jgi:hypothetical protein
MRYRFTCELPDDRLQGSLDMPLRDETALLPG